MPWPGRGSLAAAMGAAIQMEEGDLAVGHVHLDHAALLLGRACASWSQLDQSWFAAADAADPAALSRSVDLALLYTRGAHPHHESPVTLVASAMRTGLADLHAPGRAALAYLDLRLRGQYGGVNPHRP